MFLSKHFLWCVVWVLGITVVCIGVGCGNGDVVTPTETETETVQITEVTETVETLEVTDRYVGDSIIFELFGTVHEGRVVEGVSEDEVRVRMADGSEEVITVNQIAGTLIADHPDLETKVVLMGDRDKGEEVVSGGIKRVYDNGVRKIEITRVTLMDGRVKNIDRIRFVHEDTEYNEGGYLTREEFARIIGGG